MDNKPPSAPRRLPRRDYVLLPLLSLLTIVVMFAAAEAASRIFYPEDKADSCMVYDHQLGYRFRPNCTSREKAAEGPWVVNHYNECGYRTDESCGPKPAGAIRVAVVGSSISQGYLIPYQDTFSEQAATALTAECRRPVQFQNLGGIGYLWDKVYDRLDEALRLKPDAVVMATIPFDLEQTDDVAPIPPPDSEKKPKAQHDAGHLGVHFGFRNWLQATLTSSRAVLVAQHFLFENPSVYIPLYLRYGDKAGFLRLPFSNAWKTRLAAFDSLLGRMADRVHAQHIPFVLAFVPQRAEAELLSQRHLPPGVNPTAFPDALRAIAEKHGVQFIDLGQYLKRMAHPGDLYFPVDGHLSPEGQTLLGHLLSQQLQNEPDPAFGACQVSRSAANQVPRQ